MRHPERLNYTYMISKISNHLQHVPNLVHNHEFLSFYSFFVLVTNLIVLSARELSGNFH